MPVEVIRYTPEQLLHLRESPLITKPDGLPSIEQWMEPPPEQNQRKGGRTQGGRNDDQQQQHENGQRPSLFPNKHFTRHSNTAPEDIVLGPPKMAFTSSSRVPKASDPNDKDDEAADSRANIRDKFFKEREERKNGALNGRRQREEGEGWTNVRGRRTSFTEDPERPPRMGGRFNRDGEGDEPGPRRNGARGRFDWGRDSTDNKDGETGRSWRERRDDREWARGNRVEEQPEWMDTPVKKKDEIGMGRFQRPKGPEWLEEDPKEDKKAHTQEDFQRWKEQMRMNMKGGAPAAEDKEDTPEPAPARDTPTSSKPITPMVLEGKDMFGMWGLTAKQEALPATEGAAAPAKTKLPAKQSKFAKLFSPQEEQPQQLPPPPQSQMPQPQMPQPQMPQPQMPQPQMPQPQMPQSQLPQSQLPPLEINHAVAANGSNEDKEGFQRILQMLGSTNITTQSPSQSSAPSRKPSVFSPVETRSPDRDTVHVQPQPTRHHILRSREEKAGFIESVLAPRGTPTEFKGPQGAYGPFSPAIEQGQEPLRNEPRPDSVRSPEERMLQSTPSNGMNTFGIQGLIGSQAPPHAAQLSRDREFLLNLMTNTQRNTPPQQSQARVPPPDIFGGGFLDKGMPPRGNPPPGLFEDRQFPENDVRYQPQPRRMPDNPEIENALRRANRFNLPVHLDDPAIAGIQRRNTADGGLPRTNMGIPQQPPPDQMWTMKPPGLQQAQDRPPVSTMAPPPGFPGATNNPNMRGPPGFGGPNVGAPFSAGNTPLGHPGMQVQRGPPGTGPASAGPGPNPSFFNQNHGGPGGPGGPPHGYFAPPPPGPPPPPGFGPGGPMGMGGGPVGPGHDHIQQMMAGMRGSISGAAGSHGGPPPGMGMGPGMRGPGGMGGPPGGMGAGPNGFEHFFENQRRGSHVQGPFGL